MNFRDMYSSPSTGMNHAQPFAYNWHQTAPFQQRINIPQQQPIGSGTVLQPAVQATSTAVPLPNLDQGFASVLPESQVPQSPVPDANQYALYGAGSAHTAQSNAGFNVGSTDPVTKHTATNNGIVLDNSPSAGSSADFFTGSHSYHSGNPNSSSGVGMGQVAQGVAPDSSGGMFSGLGEWFGDEGNRAMANMGLGLANFGLGAYTGLKGLDITESYMNEQLAMQREQNRMAKESYNNTVRGANYTSGRQVYKEV